MLGTNYYIFVTTNLIGDDKHRQSDPIVSTAEQSDKQARIVKARKTSENSTSVNQLERYSHLFHCS